MLRHAPEASMLFSALLAWGCHGDECADTAGGSTSTPAATALACADCHVSNAAAEQESLHQATMDDVAVELAEARVGETPDDVLSGADPENCIACHAPTAVLANGGMSEAAALEYFFTTDGGAFSAQTQAAHSDEWPHVACAACHDAPDDHPASAPQLAAFDSSTAQYTAMPDASNLCGQCHGSLRFADTDHLTFDAWAATGHGDNQQDVAVELAEERGGESPHEVVTGGDPENCIACHAPTAVLANGGMSEEQALDYFFTTTDGAFTGATTPASAEEWPDVACIACHDPHTPDVPSYFNSSTHSWQVVEDTDQLCGQCHGSLRFAGTDHLSYDVRTGTAGVGVADDQLMGGVTCVQCHMFVLDEEGSTSSMQHGHSFAITKDDGATTACVECHAGMDVASTIEEYQTEYADLDAVASGNVEAAADQLAGSDDAALLDKLDEAQHNLDLAEGDESGGFHNHSYLMALLNDANDRALEILGSR